MNKSYISWPNMIFHPQLQKSSKPQQQSRALLISDLTSQLGIMALQFSMDLIVRSIVVATIIPPSPRSYNWQCYEEYEYDFL